jgi:hypothetical protein
MRVKKKRRRHRAKYGRLYIFGLFLWLRMIDLAVLRFLHPHLSVGYQHWLVVFLMAIGLWSTGLLAALWFRQTWAKYVLVATLLLVIIGSVSILPSLPDSGDSQYKLWLILSVVMVYLPVVLVLVASKHIHNLTESRTLGGLPQ